MAGVPAALVPFYDAAAASCDNYYITGAVLAAQGKAESGWRNDAVGSDPNPKDRGIGIAQFTDGTWKTWGHGGDRMNPADSIAAQGRFMCALSKDKHITEAWSAQGGRLDSVSLPFMLSGYNAGVGAVQKAKGVPNYGVTQAYIHKILDWSGTYDGMQPEFASKVKALIEDPEAHHNLWLRYGYRSYDEQKALWVAELAKQHGNEWEAGRWVANPDVKRSRHMDGLAADVNGDLGLVTRLAPKYGLCQPVSGEAWHLESCNWQRRKEPWADRSGAR